MCVHTKKEDIRMIEGPRYIEKLDYKEMQKAWHQTRSDIMPIVILFTFNYLLHRVYLTRGSFIEKSWLNVV